jgi:hypothetical protein
MVVFLVVQITFSPAFCLCRLHGRIADDSSTKMQRSGVQFTE